MKEAKKFIRDREIRYEVKTYIEDCKCGNCRMGWLRPSGEAVSGKTPHTCPHCQRVALISGEPYPRTIIKRIQLTAGEG